MAIKLSDAQRKVIKLLIDGWQLHYNDYFKPDVFGGHPSATLVLPHKPPKRGIAEQKYCDIRTARILDDRLRLIKRKHRFLGIYIYDDTRWTTTDDFKHIELRS